jgi:serine/threonine protein kinase
LTESESDDGFPDAPALALPAHFVSHLAPTAMVGRSLGSYHLTGLLGAGGMGEVYRARDTKLGRDVAIKILPRPFTSDPDRLARFEREARMLASLNHPNICAIYGLEEADGLRSWFSNPSRERRSRTSSQTSASAAGRWGSPLADALTIARQVTEPSKSRTRGIIHRDLKPANIQLTPGGREGPDRLAKIVGGDGSRPDYVRPRRPVVGRAKAPSRTAAT